MRTIGIISTTVGAVVVLTAIYVGVRSIPDIRRYLRIRRM